MSGKLSFTEEQLRFLILEYGCTKSITAVRRKFRLYYHLQPDKVPGLSSFRRAIWRFHQYPLVHQTRKKTVVHEVNIEIVTQYFQCNPRSSIRQAVHVLRISYGSVWYILRKILKWNAYRDKPVQRLSPLNKQQRLAACQFMVNQPDEWFSKVIWTDEKIFQLMAFPNRQNCRYWAPVNPHNIRDSQRNCRGCCPLH